MKSKLFFERCVHFLQCTQRSGVQSYKFRGHMVWFFTVSLKTDIFCVCPGNLFSLKELKNFFLPQAQICRKFSVYLENILSRPQLLFRRTLIGPEFNLFHSQYLKTLKKLVRLFFSLENINSITTNVSECYDFDK